MQQIWKAIKWEADFSNITQPKYILKHCNQDYIIRIDTVRVEMARGERASSKEQEEKIEQKQQIKKKNQMAEVLQRLEENQNKNVSSERLIKEEEKRQPRTFKEE
jgi:hypothetical protein